MSDMSDYSESDMISNDKVLNKQHSVYLRKESCSKNHKPVVIAKCLKTVRFTKKNNTTSTATQFQNEQHSECESNNNYVRNAYQYSTGSNNNNTNYSDKRTTFLGNKNNSNGSNDKSSSKRTTITTAIGDFTHTDSTSKIMSPKINPRKPTILEKTLRVNAETAQRRLNRDISPVVKEIYSRLTDIRSRSGDVLSSVQSSDGSVRGNDIVSTTTNIENSSEFSGGVTVITASDNSTNAANSNLDNIKSGNLHINSDRGNLHINSDRGNLHINSDRGNLHIGGDSGNLHINGDCGNLHIDSGNSGSLDAKDSSHMVGTSSSFTTTTSSHIVSTTQQQHTTTDNNNTTINTNNITSSGSDVNNTTITSNAAVINTDNSHSNDNNTSTDTTMNNSTQIDSVYAFGCDDEHDNYWPLVYDSSVSNHTTNNNGNTNRNDTNSNTTTTTNHIAYNSAPSTMHNVMDYSSSGDSDAQRGFSQARTALSTTCNNISGGGRNVNNNSSNHINSQNHNNSNNNNSTTSNTANNHSISRSVNFNTTTLSNHRTVESGYDTTLGGGYSSSGRRRLPCRMKTIHKPKFEYHQTDAEIRNDQLKVMKAYGYVETKEQKAARIAFEATQYSSDDEKQMEARRERVQDRKDTAAARVAALGVRERVPRAASIPAVVTSQQVAGGKRGTKNNNNTTSGLNVNITTTNSNTSNNNTSISNTNTITNSQIDSINHTSTTISSIVVNNAEPDLPSVPAVVVVVPSVIQSDNNNNNNVSVSGGSGGISDVSVDIISSSSSSSVCDDHNVSSCQHTNTFTTTTSADITSASKTDLVIESSILVAPSLCVLGDSNNVDNIVSGSGDGSISTSVTSNNNDTDTNSPTNNYISVGGDNNNINVSFTQDKTTSEQQPTVYFKRRRKQTPTLFEKQKRHLLQQEYPSRRNDYSTVQSQQTELLDSVIPIGTNCVQSNPEQNTINNHSSGQVTHVMVTTSTAGSVNDNSVPEASTGSNTQIETTSSTSLLPSPQARPVNHSEDSSLHTTNTTTTTNTRNTNTTSSKQDKLLYNVASIISHSGNIKSVRTLRFTVHWVGYSADETSELSWSDLKRNKVMHLYLIENGLRHLIPKDYQNDYSELSSPHSNNSNNNTINTSHVIETTSSTTTSAAIDQTSPQISSGASDDVITNNNTNTELMSAQHDIDHQVNSDLFPARKRGRPRKHALNSTLQHDEHYVAPVVALSVVRSAVDTTQATHTTTIHTSDSILHRDESISSSTSSSSSSSADIVITSLQLESRQHLNPDLTDETLIGESAAQSVVDPRNVASSIAVADTVDADHSGGEHSQDVNCAMEALQQLDVDCVPLATTSNPHSAPPVSDAQEQPTNKKRSRPIATKNTSSSSDIDSSSDSGSDSDSSGSDGTDGDDERVNEGSKKHKQHKRPPRKIARRHHNDNNTNISTNNNNATNNNPSDNNNNTIKRRKLSVKKSLEDISNVFLKSGVHKRSSSAFDSESETDGIRAGRDGSSGAKRKQARKDIVDNLFNSSSSHVEKNNHEVSKEQNIENNTNITSNSNITTKNTITANNINSNHDTHNAIHIDNTTITTNNNLSATDTESEQWEAADALCRLLSAQLRSSDNNTTTSGNTNNCDIDVSTNLSSNTDHTLNAEVQITQDTTTQEQITPNHVSEVLSTQQQSGEIIAQTDCEDGQQQPIAVIVSEELAWPLGASGVTRHVPFTDCGLSTSIHITIQTMLNTSSNSSSSSRSSNMFSAPPQISRRTTNRLHQVAEVILPSVLNSNNGSADSNSGNGNTSRSGSIGNGNTSSSSSGSSGSSGSPGYTGSTSSDSSQVIPSVPPPPSTRSVQVDLALSDDDSEVDVIFSPKPPDSDASTAMHSTSQSMFNTSSSSSCAFSPPPQISRRTSTRLLRQVTDLVVPTVLNSSNGSAGSSSGAGNTSSSGSGRSGSAISSSDGGGGGASPRQWTENEIETLNEFVTLRIKHYTEMGVGTLRGVDLTQIAKELNKTVPQCRDQWMSDKLVRGEYSDAENNHLNARYAALKVEWPHEGFFVEVSVELNRCRCSVNHRLNAILEKQKK